MGKQHQHQQLQQPQQHGRENYYYHHHQRRHQSSISRVRSYTYLKSDGTHSDPPPPNSPFELAQKVVTTADLAIHVCFPFSGDTRRQDYDRYCEAKGLVDPHPASIDDWLKFVEETFSSWDTKTINGRAYSIGASFDAEDRSVDPYRDTLRFCYFYYLLQEKKLAHCDVAPRNVIITWQGPVLIDFGCTVKFDKMNLNALPRDVTPAYYLERRGRILPSHDLKGFYITACEHFGLKMDEAMMAKLNQKNYMTIDEVVLNSIRQYLQ